MNNDFTIIYFTLPDFYDGEASEIIRHFENGLEILHLRKPNSSADEYENLLKEIPEEFHDRMTLHDHFHLAERYNVGGVHLNSRNPEYNGNKTIRLSKSCHSFDELKNIEGFNYVTLSPIFNSISKKGYNAAFSEQELVEQRNNGLINKKIIALGGIDHSKILTVKNLGFGGAAMMGAVWNKKQTYD